MSSTATATPSNAATAGEVDVNMHRDKRSKPSIEVEETGESVRRACQHTDMQCTSCTGRKSPPHLCLPEQILQTLKATCTRARARWTAELELEVLCNYWTLLAARLPATSFSFRKYDPKAVENKLQKLRGRLNPMVY